MSWRETSAAAGGSPGARAGIPIQGAAPRVRLTEIRHRAQSGRWQDTLAFFGVATERIEIVTPQDASGRRVSQFAMPIM